MLDKPDKPRRQPPGSSPSGLTRGSRDSDGQATLGPRVSLRSPEDDNPESCFAGPIIPVSFTLNGAPVAVAAPPFASLANTLRDKLGLIGTKIGCEAGDCGACTVLMNDEQVCACLVATAQAEGAEIH